MLEYKRIEENAWNEFGKNLLKDKGSEEQRSFLRACRGGRDVFLTYLDKKLFNKENAVIDGKLVEIKYKFSSDDEFYFPPESIQEIIWDIFEDVPYEIKMKCGFWGYITINMIASDCIKPSFLAFNLKGVNGEGDCVLDKVLKEPDNVEIIDSCVRRVLRSLCNPAPRGKRIVFNDFSLGKSYWRWNWAKKMSGKINIKCEDILAIFKEKSYAIFSAKMHSGKSYISQTNTLGGLLLFLNSNLEKKVGKVIDKISFVSVWKAIEFQTPEENKEEIEKIAKDI